MKVLVAGTILAGVTIAAVGAVPSELRFAALVPAFLGWCICARLIERWVGGDR